MREIDQYKQLFFSTLAYILALVCIYFNTCPHLVLESFVYILGQLLITHFVQHFVECV
jgi:hypothetical protein